jgi:lipopolysaccharide transport system ATP-binding protein
MSSVIQVRNLSKRYRIGLKEKRADTFIGQLGQLLRAPLDNFRQLRNLSRFQHDDESVFWALRDIDFEVQQGEVLGIIGHNGAGKSTLLKILSRITEPTTGEVRLRGRVSALLEVGTGFHPELTGRENIFMNGTILGMTRREIDAKLDEIVDFSGVEKYIDTPVKFYSSGMKVRLGFAVAAHLEPEILIIDEVLAVGDAEFQKKCLGKMEDVAQEGRTVLFVSHDMGAIQVLCPNSILLNKGIVISRGPTLDIIETYLKKDDIANAAFSFDCEEISIEALNCRIDNDIIQIEILYYIKNDIHDLFIGFTIKNNRGNKIFKTYDLIDTRSTFRQKGKYTSTFSFSAKTLLPGSYHINIHLMIKKIKWLLKESSNIFFEIPHHTNIHGIDISGIINAPGKWEIKK